jgi:hypothetical protein
MGENNGAKIVQNVFGRERERERENNGIWPFKR